MTRRDLVRVFMTPLLMATACVQVDVDGREYACAVDDECGQGWRCERTGDATEGSCVPIVAGIAGSDVAGSLPDTLDASPIDAEQPGGPDTQQALDSAEIDSQWTDTASVDTSATDAVVDTGPPPSDTTAPPDGDAPDATEPPADVPTDAPDTTLPCGGRASCDDGDPCTADECISSGCTHTSLTGPACDDGDACTQYESCDGGLCMGGTAVSCDDGEACTSDSCWPATGCVHSPVNGECSDGNPCTVGDECDGGECASGANECVCSNSGDCPGDGDLCDDELVCVDGSCKSAPGTAVECPPGDDPCTLWECVPETGECAAAYADDGKVCDDDDPCTTAGQCAGGECKGQNDLDCYDGSPCTADDCTADGCKHPPVDGPCNDGSQCTENDTCAKGVCSGVPLDCDDGNPCTEDACHPWGTECTHTPVDGTCFDAAQCAEGSCVAGVCQSAPGPGCDDGNDCTDDSCDGLGSCIHTPSWAPCDDGDPCTVGESCSSQTCGGGAPKVCDDGNPCTGIECSIKAAGGCVWNDIPGPCDDGNACTSGDLCASGSCVGSAELDCYDGNPCTNDTCNPATGCHFPNNTGACDDGDLCTYDDVCSGGECQGKQNQCTGYQCPSGGKALCVDGACACP